MSAFNFTEDLKNFRHLTMVFIASILAINCIAAIPAHAAEIYVSSRATQPVESLAPQGALIPLTSFSIEGNLGATYRLENVRIELTGFAPAEAIERMVLIRTDLIDFSQDATTELVGASGSANDKIFTISPKNFNFNVESSVKLLVAGVPRAGVSASGYQFGAAIVGVGISNATTGAAVSSIDSNFPIVGKLHTLNYTLDLNVPKIEKENSIIRIKNPDGLWAAAKYVKSIFLTDADQSTTLKSGQSTYACNMKHGIAGNGCVFEIHAVLPALNTLAFSIIGPGFLADPLDIALYHLNTPYRLAPVLQNIEASSPSGSNSLIIPSQKGCIQSPAYTGDACDGYRHIGTLDASAACYTLDQCLPNQGNGTCVKSPAYAGDTCGGYRVMGGISRACYSYSQCAVAHPDSSGIKVVSPNGGEALRIGTVYEVKNQYSGESELSYALFKGSQKLGFLSGTRPSDTSFLWNVGEYSPMGGGSKLVALPSNDYYIGLGVPGGTAPVDMSDAAFALEAAPLPKITSFAVTDPRVNAYRDATASWYASGATDANLDIGCNRNDASLYIPEDGHSIDCSKGYSIAYKNQSWNQITVRPSENSEKEVMVTFVLTLLKDNSPTGESRKVVVTFPGVPHNGNADKNQSTPASAANSDLQSQIALILAQIKALQSQLDSQKQNASASSAALPAAVNAPVTENTKPEELGLSGNETETFSYAWNQDLYYGMTGNKGVAALQNALVLEGCYSGPVTGNFFRLTRDGVVCFQKKHNFNSIPGTGYVGPYTRKILNESYSK